MKFTHWLANLISGGELTRAQDRAEVYKQRYDDMYQLAAGFEATMRAKDTATRIAAVAREALK